MASGSSEVPNIPRLQNSTGFAIWRLYFNELMRQHGALYVHTRITLGPPTSTPETCENWCKDDQKAGPQILLNLAKQSATLFTALLISRISKEV